MNLNPEQIDRWLIAPTEDQQLEFKEAKLQYDTSRLCKYCVAIANEGGGYLVLGVTDQKPRKVVGTEAFNDLQKITSMIYERIGFRVNVTEVAHPGGRVLVFMIPPRPRGTAYNYEGAYLMRIGSELRPMSEDQLRRIFSEGEPGEKPDWLQQPAVSDVNAQDISRLLDIQAFFHCVWQYVLRQQMTNQSLRKRFGLFVNDAPIVSQIIADAMKSKLIKPDPGASGSKKYARYLPVWA